LTNPINSRFVGNPEVVLSVAEEQAVWSGRRAGERVVKTGIKSRAWLLIDRLARDLGVVERMLPSQVASQFSRSGYHDLDAQKIEALAVKKPCQRSASLSLCDRKL
jgi:hypothetical protein